MVPPACPPACPVSASNPTACRELPASISGLSTLEELSLQGNPGLAFLPDQLGSLPALRDLSAADCALAALPSSLATAPALQSLSLYGNQLHQFSPALLQVRGARGWLPRAACPPAAARWLGGKTLPSAPLALCAYYCAHYCTLRLPATSYIHAAILHCLLSCAPRVCACRPRSSSLCGWRATR